MNCDEPLNQEIPFTVLSDKNESLNLLASKHVGRNLSWRSAYLLKQVILVEVAQMANIRYIVLDDFQYGCEISVCISENRRGPFIDILQNKYFSHGKTRKIPLGSLPCRFLKIISTKGVHLNPNNIRLLGAISEDLADLNDDNQMFEIMVALPQKIIYS